MMGQQQQQTVVGSAVRRMLLVLLAAAVMAAMMAASAVPAFAVASGKSKGLGVEASVGNEVGHFNGDNGAGGKQIASEAPGK